VETILPFIAGQFKLFRKFRRCRKLGFSALKLGKFAGTEPQQNPADEL
jgi:hypothetical protein